MARRRANLSPLRPQPERPVARLKTGTELVAATPSLHQYRRAIILALCSGTSVNTPNYTTTDIALRITDVANQILAETEQ